MKPTRLLAGLLVVTVGWAPARAITIQFNYTYDTAGFFTGNPTAKATLETVGQMFSNRLTDTLSAIIPSGSNSWDMSFSRPDTGASGEWVHNASVAANTLVVYVGSRDIGGTTLAQGGPGGWSASGTQSWLDLVQTRGETNVTGPTATDVGPWGGVLSFDSDAGGFGWHYDYSTPVAAGKADLYSTAMHEMAHLLGIGTEDSWKSRVNYSGGTYYFSGPMAVAEHGGSVPLDSGQSHWQQGVMSKANGYPQEAVVVPTLTIGSRRQFTELDWAGLDDVGWDVASPGVLRGDLNRDRLINVLDVQPFVVVLTTQTYQAEADLNNDGAVNALDIEPFVVALTGGGGVAAAAIPEPSTAVMGVLAMGAVLGRRRAG